MKKLNASGAIGMLLTLLIISIVFISVMPTLKGNISSGGSFAGGPALETKSVEEHVDQQVRDIEKMRKESLKNLGDINQEF